jgi:hypothetical protein
MRAFITYRQVYDQDFAYLAGDSTIHKHTIPPPLTDAILASVSGALLYTKTMQVILFNFTA